MFIVDLNCDLGESFGSYNIGNDEKILDYVTSVNIACGYHAGDPMVMNKTVELALKKKVAIGAHPGLPDLMGFGRRNMSVSPDEARAYVIYQLGALQAFVTAHGGKLQHVKPHGALYNMAAVDYKLAKGIVEAVYAVNPELIFVGLANSMMIRAAKDLGLSTASEVFADRAYNQDGTLVARNVPGAVIHDNSLCIARVIEMVKEKSVATIDGGRIALEADTICIHGDNPSAFEFVEELRNKAKENGIVFQPINK